MDSLSHDTDSLTAAEQWNKAGRAKRGLIFKRERKVAPELKDNTAILSPIYFITLMQDMFSFLWFPKLSTLTLKSVCVTLPEWNPAITVNKDFSKNKCF